MIRRPMLGNKQAMTLTYITQTALAPPGGSLPNAHVFSANSLFDPDRSGAGHQPRGFDQIGQLFGLYTVVGSRCTAQFTNESSANDKYIVGVALRATSVIATTQFDYMESRNSKYSTMGSLSPKRTLMKTFSARKFFSVPHPLSDDTIGGALSLPQA